jgi:hypothetical protein
MRRTNKSGGRQPAVVPETASATATDFSEPSTFAPARSVTVPRLAYASRSWLPARMLLLMCVSYPQVRYPHHGWLTPAAPGCKRRVFRAECDICDAQTHTHKSGGRQPAVVPETASATATDFSEPSTFAPARSVTVPRLAYASRSWLRARMLLLMCVSYPQVRYPFPRLAYASRSWLRDIQRFDCRAYPPVTKLPEPFFHPNRIKTTTLYPTGRGAARTCSEKQSRYERAKKRGEFAGLLERIRRNNPTHEVHGSG